MLWPEGQKCAAWEHTQNSCSLGNRSTLNTKVLSLNHYGSSIPLPERQNGTVCFPGSDGDKNIVPLTASPRFLYISLSLSLSRFQSAKSWINAKIEGLRKKSTERNSGILEFATTRKYNTSSYRRASYRSSGLQCPIRQKYIHKYVRLCVLVHCGVPQLYTTIRTTAQILKSLAFIATMSYTEWPAYRVPNFRCLLQESIWAKYVI